MPSLHSAINDLRTLLILKHGCVNLCVAGAMEEGNDILQTPDYKTTSMSDDEITEFFNNPEVGQHTHFSKIVMVGPPNQGKTSSIRWFLRVMNYNGEQM